MRQNREISTNLAGDACHRDGPLRSDRLWVYRLDDRSTERMTNVLMAGDADIHNFPAHPITVMDRRSQFVNHIEASKFDTP